MKHLYKKSCIFLLLLFSLFNVTNLFCFVFVYACETSTGKRLKMVKKNNGNNKIHAYAHTHNVLVFTRMFLKHMNTGKTLDSFLMVIQMLGPTCLPEIWRWRKRRWEIRWEIRFLPSAFISEFLLHFSIKRHSLANTQIHCHGEGFVIFQLVVGLYSKILFGNQIACRT